MAQFEGDVIVNGTMIPNKMRYPDGSVSDAAVGAGADIQDGKMRHRFTRQYAQAPGANIAAATLNLHIVRGLTGTLLAVEAALTGVAPTTDRTASVDLQRGNAGGAFATMLSATIDFANGDALRTVKAGAIPSPALADGDILRVVVTVAGSTGTQPQGLVVTVTVMEKA